MLVYTNTDITISHMMFIGRWNPLHKGHTWIVNKKIQEHSYEKPALILIRSTSYDQFTPQERAEIIKAWFIHEKIEGTIMIIPDIEGVYYGRGVGYNVEEVEPPENIGNISATKIRNLIENNDNTWKDLVAPGTETLVKFLLTKEG